MTEITRIDIDGLDKVRKFFVKMPKKLVKGVSKSNQKFMEKVKSTARKLVPKDTGTLREDIQLKPVRKGRNVRVWKIQIRNPAAAPQEFGFKPHFAPILNSSKMPPGIYFVRKSTPFLRPSIEMNLSSFSQQLNNSVRRAIIT